MKATPTFSLAGERNDRVITAITNAAHHEAMQATYNPLRAKADKERRLDMMRTRLADMMVEAEAEPVDQETFEALVESAITLSHTYRSVMTQVLDGTAPQE